MVAVAVSPDEARKAIDDDADRVELARSTATLVRWLASTRSSGSDDAAGARRRVHAMLKIQYGFHSRHLPIARSWWVSRGRRAALFDDSFRVDRDGMSLDGKWLRCQLLGGQLRRPVLFGPPLES